MNETGSAVPTVPYLTLQLEQLARQGVQIRWSSNSEINKYSVDHDWKPPALDARLRAEAEQALIQLNRHLAPAPRARIAARITALLSHYFVAAMPDNLATALFDDWLDALGGFPAWALDQAAREWLRDNERKPTIAAIYRRCCALALRTMVFRDALALMVNPNGCRQALPATKADADYNFLRNDEASDQEESDEPATDN